MRRGHGRAPDADNRMINLTYRTFDGLADYKFGFEFVGGDWRIYILRQPPYRGRSESAHASHRLGLGGQGLPWVCWTDPLPTLERAKDVAALWADHTQVYIARGTFPPPGAFARPTVTDHASATVLIQQGGQAAPTSDVSGPRRMVLTPPLTSSTPPHRTWLDRLRERIG